MHARDTDGCGTDANATSSRLQLARFCVIGASGYGINLVVFALTLAVSGGRLVAAGVAFVLAAASNFWCNRRWTFPGAGPDTARQASRFFAVAVLAFLVAAAVLALLAGVAGVPALPAQAASIVAATPVNFLANKAWTFSGARAAGRPEPVAAGTARPPVAWLVVPTYNEAENLEPFVRAVLPPLASATAAHRVLIVDDGSPDGTGEIADRLAAELDAVEVLHRPRKDGLGRAYAAGFARALHGGAELVLQMDADFSHDPASVPALIAAAADADLVLGSRYVEGGEVIDWGLLRRIVSRGGSWYARTILGVPVRDLTGGFKCFRRELLESLDTAATMAGYGFQIEMTYHALLGGARVREVPIRFRDRRAGSSKMSSSIVLEAMSQVLALRLRRPPASARSRVALEPAG